MIRALVVDDDFRVAHIHAAMIERIDGFTCVGEAHSAAQARIMIAESTPDLLVLDIYLPDEDGLSLVRSLTAAGTAPDTIFITAARDLEAVRTAIGLGAVYYLVKPFGFDQLRDQLLAYQRWRDRVESAADETDQATVDSLYSLRRSTRPSPARRRLPPTMAKVLAEVTSASDPVAATDVAARLGVSRPTAQRYLTELQRRGLVELDLAYGSTGRPVHRYRTTRPR